ncbi:hypothetical protein HBI25_123660 [Parastagonospora nodorum]|nr:hypothetical protein HBH51_091980 [Parastagonospora nodorum]KAH4172452.1 hypothetical protein HBH43_090260 [Parastagonospora nodorum]KAH4211793.1 hypothetical protein HBI95_045310 [Parastagonospora nodorum]KAH4409606.1 hypothetical protein HBH92_134860 [Parastagonospora nodorum]KAH4433576.1 hypothetical protein HBH93_130860 [Parastagonospora nodorum]
MASFRFQNGTVIRLPNEILLLIISFIPIDHILSFRTVSRTIRNHIDNAVLLSYLYRARIVANADHQSANNSASKHVLLKFNFLHMEKFPKSGRPHALWEGSHAVFQVDEKWIENDENYRHWNTRGTSSLKWLSDEDYHAVADESADWFVELDRVALDLDSGVTTKDPTDYYDHTWRPGYFAFNRDALTVTFDWRIVLRNFLVMETEITRRIREQDGPDPLYHFDEDDGSPIPQVNPSPTYTYGPVADYIRACRRDTFFRVLDHTGPKDYEVDRGILRLPKLFGGHNYEGWGPPNYHHEAVKRHEDPAMEIIMDLRQGT